MKRISNRTMTGTTVIVYLLNEQLPFGAWFGIVWISSYFAAQSHPGALHGSFVPCQASLELSSKQRQTHTSPCREVETAGHQHLLIERLTSRGNSNSRFTTPVVIHGAKDWGTPFGEIRRNIQEVVAC